MNPPMTNRIGLERSMKAIFLINKFQNTIKNNKKVSHIQIEIIIPFYKSRRLKKLIWYLFPSTRD